MGLPLILGAGAAVWAGFKVLGKAFGNDPDFTQAWMMNRMTGRGGFFKTLFFTYFLLSACARGRWARFEPPSRFRRVGPGARVPAPS